MKNMKNTKYKIRKKNMVKNEFGRWWKCRLGTVNGNVTFVKSVYMRTIALLPNSENANIHDYSYEALAVFHKRAAFNYFMLFGSLSENNGGLSLDNFTVSSSEITIHRADRQFSDISGRSIVCYSSVRLANYLTENAESWVRKLRR